MSHDVTFMYDVVSPIHDLFQARDNVVWSTSQRSRTRSPQVVQANNLQTTKVQLILDALPHDIHGAGTFFPSMFYSLVRFDDRNRKLSQFVGMVRVAQG